MSHGIYVARYGMTGVSRTNQELMAISFGQHRYRAIVTTIRNKTFDKKDSDLIFNINLTFCVYHHF